MKVLQTAHWERRMGYLGQLGIEGQITVIEVGGVVAYVRENIRMDTFYITSTARLGITGGGGGRGKIKSGNIPPDAQHVLELAAPKADWDAIARAVTAADRRHRPVVKSNRWTISQATHALSHTP